MVRLAVWHVHDPQGPGEQLSARAPAARTLSLQDLRENHGVTDKSRETQRKGAPDPGQLRRHINRPSAADAVWNEQF
jgi:hypothetical protein